MPTLTVAGVIGASGSPAAMSDSVIRHMDTLMPRPVALGATMMPLSQLVMSRPPSSTRRRTVVAASASSVLSNSTAAPPETFWPVMWRFCTAADALSLNSGWFFTVDMTMQLLAFSPRMVTPDGTTSWPVSMYTPGATWMAACAKPAVATRVSAAPMVLTSMNPSWPAGPTWISADVTPWRIGPVRVSSVGSDMSAAIPKIAGSIRCA